MCLSRMLWCKVTDGIWVCPRRRGHHSTVLCVLWLVAVCCYRPHLRQVRRQADTDGWREASSRQRGLPGRDTGHLLWFNTLRPSQNGRYFADGICKCIFLNENVWISHWIWFMRVYLSYTTIGSDNDLAPTRRQAIICTNDGPGYRRIYASHNDSTHLPLDKLATKLQTITLTHCGLVTPYGDLHISGSTLVQTETTKVCIVVPGSNNGLSPDSTKPSPEPMLTSH